MTESEKKVGALTILIAVVGRVLLLLGCAGCLAVYVLPARFQASGPMPAPAVTTVPLVEEADVEEAEEPVEETEKPVLAPEVEEPER